MVVQLGVTNRAILDPGGTGLRDHSSHSGSKRHRPVILPLPRGGSCRCSVKPASRCAFLSRGQETQAFAQDSWPNSWLGTGRPESRPHAPDSVSRTRVQPT
ncbi:hypothetical protein V6N13_051669 [Hibiscus sabdariffa]